MTKTKRPPVDRVCRITLPTGTRAWLITGYDEVRQALDLTHLVESRSTLRRADGDGLPSDVDGATNSAWLHLDPPDHARLRRLVAKVFTRRRVLRLAPRVQQITDELLDVLDDDAECDLIAAFASPLPLTVICELLGVPPDRRDNFRDWATTIAAGSVTAPAARVAAATAMTSYTRELLVAKRTEPGRDLLSALVAIRDGDDRLSEDELTSMVFLLLVAGHEPTVNLIGNGVYALLTQPDQLALLQAEPERLGAALDELLRFAGPLQSATFRCTTERVEIGATTIPAGEIVLPGLSAANRDPSRFPHPGTLDLSRPDNPHLAFGHGIHRCLGAPLARLEGRIAHRAARRVARATVTRNGLENSKRARRLPLAERGQAMWRGCRPHTES
jgi:cytochrome P450